MNRISAVAATLTTAATLTAAIAATVAPAQASVPPAGSRSAAHIRTISRLTTAAELARVTAQAAVNPSVAIGSETNGGKYVTVVHCSGGATPPPIKVGQPGTPLTASGTGPSAGLLAMLSKPNPYKTVYTCTVTVKEKKPTPSASPEKKTAHRTCELGRSGASGSRAKVCHKGVTLNTGFGGMAKQVAGHHPGH